MKVYAASSWKNTRHPEVVKALLEAGHEVYDYRNPSHGRWDENSKWWETASYRQVKFPHIIDGVPERQLAWDTDWAELEKCDAVVLTLSSGRSAHLEAGFAAGAKKCLIVLGDALEEPELMYNMADLVCTEIGEVVGELERWRNLEMPKRVSSANLLAEIWRAMSRDPQPSIDNSDAWLSELGELVFEAAGKKAAEARATEAEDRLKVAAAAAVFGDMIVVPTARDEKLEARAEAAERDAQRLRMAIRRLAEAEKATLINEKAVDSSASADRQARRAARQELARGLEESARAVRALLAIDAETT